MRAPLVRRLLSDFTSSRSVDSRLIMRRSALKIGAYAYEYIYTPYITSWRSNVKRFGDEIQTCLGILLMRPHQRLMERTSVVIMTA